MSPTGGGDPWDDMRLLALADGKPFIDGETYLGHTRESHRAAILRQFARGMNASYYFKWERRLGEMKAMDEASLQRLADRFPWLGLNPAAVPPEALAGMMDAKRDIAAVQDLFGPRDRGILPAERVAVFNQVSKDMQNRLHEDDKFMLEIAHALVRQTAKKLEKQFG